MIGIVILNYNNYSDTQNCIESLLSLDSSVDFKVFLVDNSSRMEEHEKTLAYFRTIDEKALYLENWKQERQERDFPRYVYIRTDRNLGYGKGNNVALRLMALDKTIDYALVLNTDILFTKPFLAEMKDYLQQHPQVAMAAPLLYGRNGKIDLSCARDIKNIYHFIAMIPGMRHCQWLQKKAMSTYLLLKPVDMSRPVKTELISGACFMISMRLFEEIGFFDQHTFLYYEEDILGAKVKRLGKECSLLPYLSCIHLGANSSQETSSLFLKKCRIESMAYYLRHFSSFNRLGVEMLVLIFKTSYTLQKILGK